MTADAHKVALYWLTSLARSGMSIAECVKIVQHEVEHQEQLGGAYHAEIASQMRHFRDFLFDVVNEEQNKGHDGWSARLIEAQVKETL